MEDKKNMIKFRNIGKICRPHGLKGTLKLELVRQDSINFLKNAAEIDFLIDETLVQIKRVFGYHHKRCLIELSGYETIESIQNFRNQYLQHVQHSKAEFFWEDLIGLRVLQKNRVVAEITNIQDFGAGLVCDTDTDTMLAITELDLDSIADGCISLV